MVIDAIAAVGKRKFDVVQRTDQAACSTFNALPIKNKDRILDGEVPGKDDGRADCKAGFAQAFPASVGPGDCDMLPGIIRPKMNKINFTVNVRH